MSKHIRPVEIKPTLNGYLVKVGCQHLSFHSRTELIAELSRYLEDPDATEKRYRAEAINRTLITDEAATLGGQALGGQEVPTPLNRDTEAGCQEDRRGGQDLPARIGGVFSK